MSGLALTRQAIDGEVWRLWTGHLAHYDWQHLVWNAVASVTPVVVLRSRLGAVLAWSFLAAPLVSLAVLAQSTFPIEYRGASALVVGLWVAAGFHLWRQGQHSAAVVFLTAVLVKVCLETAGLWTVTAISVAPSPVAHWCGAFVGLGLPLLIEASSFKPSGKAQLGDSFSSSRSFSRALLFCGSTSRDLR